MNRKQIENLYEINGLTEYNIRNTEDLLKVHGVDFKSIDGYNRLDDINRDLYKKFIINFFNGFGLESRAMLIPKGINYVEDIEYLVKENQEDEYYTVAGGVVMAIDRSGLKSMLSKRLYEEYKELEITEGEPKKYLRFKYEYQEHKEWY